MGKKNVGKERTELAARLRQVRISLGYTQEKFAEVLGISLTAYKKIESAENQITIDGLRILNRELNVSADYLLFGKHSNSEKTWENIQNCSENDKLMLMLRLFMYFSEIKDEKFLSNKVLNELDEKILKYIK